MIEWQNNFEAVMTDRSALSDTYIKISPVPRVSEGRLVLEDNSTSNYEIIHYTSKDAGGVYTTDGGARNEDGNSNGIHAKGARVRMNLTAQDMQDIKDIAAGSVVKDGSVSNAKLSTTVGDVGGAWKSWNANPQGFSSITRANCFYTSIGKTILMSIDIVGVSNTNTFSFTLPVASKRLHRLISRVYDNNVTKDNAGFILLSAGSAIAHCYGSLSGSGWTTSSNKGIIEGLVLSYEGV